MSAGRSLRYRPPMSPDSSGSPELFRHRPFLFYLSARMLSRFSFQIGAVAIGWQIYALTNSALALGLIGLTQFVPMALLVFVAGHAADRYDRKRVAQGAQFASALAAAYLAWGSFAGWLSVPEIFAAVVVFGAAVAFENPATSAMLPLAVPDGMVQRGTAQSSAAVQIATITGPAIGGFAYALGPTVPYAAMASLWLGAGLFNGLIALRAQTVSKEPPTLARLFAGVGFVRNNPAILGTISLDLFAVLFGGVTALLPIYARDILLTGPWGLGVLRAGPAVGALLMASLLTRRPLTRRVGRRMFQAVIAFGVATLVFALSHWLWLSLLALVCLGAADMVSVVIRISLVQLRTPDVMRGRVGAVNYLFVNASSQLGDFESGVVAALIGTVPAAVVGGLGTIAVALLWMKLFPTLRAVERLE
jgi:MFS family permease